MAGFMAGRLREIKRCGAVLRSSVFRSGREHPRSGHDRARARSSSLLPRRLDGRLKAGHDSGGRPLPIRLKTAPAHSPGTASAPGGRTGGGSLNANTHASAPLAVRMRPRTLEELVLERGKFVARSALEGDETFRPALFPKLRIELAELWKGLDER